MAKKELLVASQTTLVARIEEIIAKLESSAATRGMLHDDTLPHKKYKKTNNQLHKIVCEVLRREYSGQIVSESTVYRILRIRLVDGDMYDEVAKGRIKVKQAYNILFPPREKEASVVKSVEVSEPEDSDDAVVEVRANGEPDFGELLKLVRLEAGRLEEWQYKLSEEPDMRVLREIDNELFRMRKSLGRIVAKYDVDEV